MIISIETPVFKGRLLRRCIDSVLYQSSPHWTFSLLWDGGDRESRRMLEDLDRQQLPNVTVHFAENRGIARARRFLSEHSRGDFILPLDDDDALPFHAVERFLSVAAEKPWASIIRGQRKIIDEEGKVLDTPAWFPFGPRHYQNGMVTDLTNHTQPYLIRRSAYDRTSGWEGFQDFGFAGEDCDIYLKLEETGTIELLDETLYYYRVHPKRASLVLTDQGAYEMWRRLADKTIARIGLPMKRLTDRPPFIYERTPRPEPTLAMVDFVIVAREEPARLQADRLTRCLQDAGAASDAVLVLDGGDPRSLNDALRKGTRPFACVLDAAIAGEGAGRLHALLRLMHEHDADLAAPKLIDDDGTIVWANPGFGEGNRPEARGAGDRDAGQYDGVTGAAWVSEQLVMVRREVVNAVGGLDEGYGDTRTAMVDFSLRARQRQFKCAYVGAVAFTGTREEAARDSGALDRLRLKWAAYPELFA
jgi:hypothetical protein